MRILFSTVLVVGLFLQTPSAQQARVVPASSRPKLVVIIAVDQMRADYIDRYRGQWSSGLKKLVSEGAWFRQADYPYYTTVTCAGHFSISTGAPPAVHGMTANTWWEQGATRNVACTADDTKTLVSYGAPLKSVGQSAARLMTTTFADELRLQEAVAPRIVSISLKARSAIGLVGHTPDAVIWMDEETGDWATSTAFAKEPAPYFAAYVRAHPVKDEVGRTWDRALPKERYLFDGSATGRQKTALATKAFPHIVKGASLVMDNTFTDAWESSPYSDAYLGALAAAAIDGLKLGNGAGTDYLGVSFSALDKVGHDFGPDSYEVQDVLIRLDQTIGTLLDKLDRDVGRNNYVLALSADHGVSPIPEKVQAQGLDAGRISTTSIGAAIDAVLARELGPGTYRTRVAFSEIFFNAGVYDRLLQNPRAMDAVMKTIQDSPGVRRVYRQETLLAIENEVDPLVHAAALSHYPGRNGEMFMVARAYWIAGPTTVTHGSGHRYDTHVPVVLFGGGVKTGEYLLPASPLDIAPTLAFLTGVTLPDATGRVLVEALAKQ
ncbi:MAG: alkaline phosphatase family protein [Vicinamibacterales bacterium]